MEEEKNSVRPPLGIAVVYRVLGFLIFLVAVSTFFNSLYRFYTATRYFPFILLSFSIFGFLLAAGFWLYRKWTVGILVLNALSVIIIDILRISYLPAGRLQGGMWSIIIGAVFALGFLALAYFTRRFLSGRYFQPGIIFSFGFFWIILVANYVAYLKVLSGGA